MRNTCKLGGVSFHPSLEVNHSMSNRIMMFLIFVLWLCDALTSFRKGRLRIHPLSHNFDVIVFICKCDSDNPLQRV